jgi:hypothetical protein
MALAELIQRQAEELLREFCAAPAVAEREVSLAYELSGDCITLFAEGGCSCAGKIAVARFCYNHHLQQWTVHRPDPDRQWRFYQNAGPSLNLGKLLRHVAEDPLRVFWS